MDKAEELERQLDGFNPLTDTGRAIKFLAQYILARDKEVDKTYQNVLKVAQAIDRRIQMQQQAELRSLSARASTYKANVAENED